MIRRDEKLLLKIISGALETRASNANDLAAFLTLRFGQSWTKVGFRTLYVSASAAFISLRGSNATFPADTWAFQDGTPLTAATKVTTERSRSRTKASSGRLAGQATTTGPSVTADAGENTTATAAEHLTIETAAQHNSIVAVGTEREPAWHIQAEPGAPSLTGTLLRHQLMSNVSLAPETNDVSAFARIPNYGLTIKVDGIEPAAHQNKIALTRMILKRALCDYDVQIETRHHP